MAAQIGNLLLTAESLFADQGDHLDLRSDDVEHHIETHLIVSGARTSMTQVVGSDLPCILGNSRSLRNPFGTYRDGIGSVLEHIAENHVLDRMIVIVMCNIECHVALYAQRIGPPFDRSEFLFRESARVCQCGMHFQTHLLGEIDRTIRGIQTSTKSQYYFFHGYLSL